jgi:hypothetical protein
MVAPWQRLPLSNATGEFPPMLISANFGISTYTIYVTDLVSIWVETLDRRPIISRSLDLDTSIGPSEDASQMRLFLKKLQSAIDGEPGTMVSFQSNSKSEDMKGIHPELHITCGLPKPLKPLIWRMNLSSAPSSLLCRHLTIPLFEAHSNKSNEVESLVETLKEKDHVIQKLVDKLEASGTDLGQIFP